MKSATLIIGVCSIALLFSCDMTTIKRSETWSAPPSNLYPQLTIYLADNNTRINYDGNVEQEFGKGNQDTLIWAFFKSQLVKDIARKTVFREAVYDTPDNKPLVSTEALKVSGMGDMLFKIPQKGARFSFPNSTPDFVIFLGDIIIASHFKVSDNSRRGKQSICLRPDSSAAIQLCVAGVGDWAGTTFGQFMPVPMPMPMTNYGMVHTPTTSKTLTWRARFMFYDNVSGQVVLYGYIDVEDDNALFVSMDDWLSVSDEFVAKLFKDTPFNVF